jgi:cytochrome c oxidase assembly factor CtaG
VTAFFEGFVLAFLLAAPFLVAWIALERWSERRYRQHRERAAKLLAEQRANVYFLGPTVRCNLDGTPRP